MTLRGLLDSISPGVFDRAVEHLNRHHEILKIGFAVAFFASVGSAGAFYYLKKHRIIPFKNMREAKIRDKFVVDILMRDLQNPDDIALGVEKLQYLKRNLLNADVNLYVQDVARARLLAGEKFKSFIFDVQEEPEKEKENGRHHETQPHLKIHFPAQLDSPTQDLRINEYGIAVEPQSKEMFLGIDIKKGLFGNRKSKRGLLFNQDLREFFVAKEEVKNRQLTGLKFSNELLKSEITSSMRGFYFGEVFSVDSALRFIMLACAHSKSFENPQIKVILQGDAFFDNWYSDKNYLEQLFHGMQYIVESLIKLGISKIDIAFADKEIPVLNEGEVIRGVESKRELKTLRIILPGVIPYQDTIRLFKLSHQLTTVYSDQMLSNAISAGKIFFYECPPNKIHFREEILFAWQKLYPGSNELEILSFMENQNYNFDTILDFGDWLNNSDLGKKFEGFSNWLYQNYNFDLYLLNRIHEAVKKILK